MLHHFDKTDLQKFSLADVLSTYDDEVSPLGFAKKLQKTCKYATTAKAVAGAKQVFKNTYMKSSK